MRGMYDRITGLVARQFRVPRSSVALATPEYLRRPAEDASYGYDLNSRAQHIASGTCYHSKCERQSDRYGSVIIDSTENQRFDVKPYCAKSGNLFAMIVRATAPDGIGDIALNIRPRNVQAGQVVDLGAGKLTVEDKGTYRRFEIEPNPPRATFWMDPQAVHDCYGQDVSLYFQPD